MKRSVIFVLILGIAALACGGQAPAALLPTPKGSSFDAGRTVYGFFPSPPEVSQASVLKLYKDLGDHADFVLIQQNTPWQDFVSSVGGDFKSSH